MFITNFSVPAEQIKQEESIDEFLSATNIEDFLWYNCPKCDFKCKTSPNFIEHVVQIHPRAKHVIEELTMKRSKDLESEENEQNTLEEVEDFINYDMMHQSISEDDDEDPLEHEEYKGKGK